MNKPHLLNPQSTIIIAMEITSRYTGYPSQKRGNEIGKLQLNDKVAVLNVSNNFAKIRFYDKIG